MKLESVAQWFRPGWFRLVKRASDYTWKSGSWFVFFLFPALLLCLCCAELHKQLVVIWVRSGSRTLSIGFVPSIKISAVKKLSQKY